MSSPGAPPSAPNRRQKRMGPAPFASFEDLSDELDSPEDKNASGSVVRLPGIREDVTPCSPAPQDIKAEFIYTGISLIGAPSTPTMHPVPKASLQTPSAPRIDISRASSSSHHDSKDSSPDREGNVKNVSGFREDGTIDLRSSTEELDFQEKNKARPLSPVMHEDSYHSHNRKDSQSSEIGLLCISGRTSRLSSIGSQGSAHSRVSNASRLSIISGQSGLSRSPSPHKMLLETSFCGTKAQKKEESIEKEDGTKEDLESVLLKRKFDPTQVLIAEGITVHTPKPEKPVRKLPPDPPKQIKSDITIKVDKPTNDIITPKLPKRIIAESGIEYIYIPLKGPLPEDNSAPSNGAISKRKVRETKSASLSTKGSNVKETGKQPKSKSASPSPLVSRHHHLEEPKYIRIKLKPDHMYDDDNSIEVHKPDTLDLTEPTKKPIQNYEEITTCRITSPHLTPSASPKPIRHLQGPSVSSKSPSPSLSRKSSFASIFKSRETISPESPTSSQRRKSTLSGVFRDGESRERRRSRSKSRDRSFGPSSTESIDSKGKSKSVFSLFKTKKSSQKELDRASPELPNLEGLINVEFRTNSEKKSPRPKKYYETPLEGDSVRIPLHSPTYYEQKSILQDFKTSSQDSQETVIEVAPKTCDNRQSSTSSENLVFSTRLGSNNELFTTKLPKDKSRRDEFTTAIVETRKLSRSSEAEDEKVDIQEATLDTVIKSESKSSIQEKVLEDTSRKIKETKEEIIQEKAVTPKEEPKEQPKVFTSEIEVATTKIVDRKDKPKKPTVVSLGAKQVPLSLNLDKVEPTKIDVVESQKRVTPKESRGDVPESKIVENRVTKSESSKSIGTAAGTSKSSPASRHSKNLDFERDVAYASPETVEKRRSEEMRKVDTSEFTLKYQRSDAISPDLEAQLQARRAELPERKFMDEELNHSSESERDSEIDKKERVREEIQIEPERKGLVLQQDSFEDELPYIPTTLPQERSVAVPIIPIKQRASIDVKTCPIDRPRSTTPINPTFLEGYHEETKKTKTIEKLKINLPRSDDEKVKIRSPRRTGSGNWFDFSKIKKEDETPPPLPPKGVQKEWINFEEIPEKRKAPKRIQTIPSRSNIEVPENVLQENVIYTYVNPEDCKCECHERANQPRQEEEHVREDELPLLEDDPVEDEKGPPVMDKVKLDVTILDRRSLVSDSSLDLSTHVEHPDANGIDHSLRTPFTSDLGMSSNRSSIISQDEVQSPDTDSPNAFPKKI